MTCSRETAADSPSESRREPEPQNSRIPEALRHCVTRGTELIARTATGETPSPLPTAIEPLDRILVGGLPRGCLIEVTGRNTSGRFSLVLSTLAATTASGDVAALIDLGDNLDPENASELGVDLDRLLWLRPKHLQPALLAAEVALQTGFPLVVLDLGEPPVRGGRGPTAAWLRLTRAAALYRSTIYVSSPYRVSGTAAATVFEAERAETSWRGGNRAPRLLEAIRFHWRLQKTHYNSHDQNLSFALSAADAFLGEVANVRWSQPAPPRAAPRPRFDRHAAQSA